MSLATRCTACGTIFRVVQDQLRVSEGWVRCGRCAEVFDARQQLFDIEREAPPPWPASAPAPGAHALARQDEHEHRIEAASVREDESIEHIDFAGDEPALPQEPMHIESAAADLEHDEPRWIDEPALPQQAAEPPAPAPITLPADLGPDVVLSPSLQPQKKTKEKPKAKPAKPRNSKAEGEGAAQVPSFVRRAQARERWRRPRVRLALGLASVLLVGVLAAQFAVQFRDALAAQYPGAKPVLAALCGVAGCEIEPWRHIEVLSVENTGLAQAGTGNQYQLSVSLLNKGSVMRWPPRCRVRPAASLSSSLRGRRFSASRA